MNGSSSGPMQVAAHAALNLLVLRCGDVAASLVFYQALELEFVEERHGAGPTHFAATMGELVIELYPRPDARPTEGSGCDPARLGFTVSTLDGVLARLADLGVLVESPPRATRWGRRAVVRDPDGRAVELVESAG
ncbi:MAG TPA: VOC family protein [Chthonomonadaceae bacterium]|nr:VOC family protein [Chthonomonadaceae bacterium]